MNEIVKNIELTIYCNFMVELNDEFKFDANRNVYYKYVDIESDNQPDWLKYNRIELEFTDENRSGFYREFYASGKLRREVPFISIGEENTYYADGVEKIFYEDLDSEGNETYTILEENEYKQGERDGIWKTYSIDGGLMKEDYFNDVIDAKPGFYGLKQIEYFPSTKKIATINEKDNGKAYYENGSLKAEWKNKNYFKEGDYIEYYETGNLKMKVTYIDGERDGLMPKYYEDGTLKEEWKYSNGVRIYVKKFYPNGMIKSEWLYNNGELIEKNEFDKNGNLKTKK